MWSCWYHDAQKNGMEVLSQIWVGAAVPVLMLTASIRDWRQGRRTGGRQTIEASPPFATRNWLQEWRRLPAEMDMPDTVLSLGNVRLDCNRYELSCKEETVRLKCNANTNWWSCFPASAFVFSTDHLMDKVWGRTRRRILTLSGHTRVHQEKAETYRCGYWNKTVRGAGYSPEAQMPKKMKRRFIASAMVALEPLCWFW